MVQVVNASDFDKEVLNSDKRVLVDFYADWCMPCKMQGPIVEKFSEAHPEIKVCKMNIDSTKENTEIAITYNILSIPALLVFENGEVKNEIIGLTELDELTESVCNA